MARTQGDSARVKVIGNQFESGHEAGRIFDGGGTPNTNNLIEFIQYMVYALPSLLDTITI